MSWLTRRLDHLGSATAGGAGGLGFSQAPAFTHAYLQRLGGHIDEAHRTIDKVAAGEFLPWLDEARREQAVSELSLRLAELQQLQQALLETPAMLRPVALLRHADWSIARGAAEAFVPAVPVDPASIVWTLIGVVLLALCWDACKLPFWAAGKARRQRATPQQPSPARKMSDKRRRSGENSSVSY
ncbi:MAG: DUF2937 family protein [Wenzhouxiangellaceae bacterium]